VRRSGSPVSSGALKRRYSERILAFSDVRCAPMIGGKTELMLRRVVSCHATIVLRRVSAARMLKTVLRLPGPIAPF
jgi:hypothetical protein